MSGPIEKNPRTVQTKVMRRGFTLIEVLTTITIIGVLVALTSYVYNSSLIRSRDGQRKTDIGTIKNAVEQFYLDNRAYPAENLTKGAIYNAKWQLESWQVSGGNDCWSTVGGRQYLAPFYLATVPEDPQYKLPLTGSCANLLGNNLYGEYLYFVTDKTNPKPTAGYYLFARMEAARNANLTGAEQTTIGTGASGWGYSLNGLEFCTSNSTVKACSHNYQAKSARNQ